MRLIATDYETWEQHTNAKEVSLDFSPLGSDLYGIGIWSPEDQYHTIQLCDAIHEYTLTNRRHNAKH